MVTSELILNSLIGLVITAIVYLFVPIIIIISKKQFAKKMLKKIMIFNGIGGFFLFSFFYAVLGNGDTANVLVAGLWSSIGFAILKHTSCTDNENYLKEDPNRVTECKSCGYRSKKYFDACPQCGAYAKQYVYVNKEDVSESNNLVSKGAYKEQGFHQKTNSIIDDKTKNHSDDGKKAFNKTFKPVLYIFLSLIIIFLGFCGYNCSCFTKALNNEDFIKAEQHLNYIPLGESIYASEVEYLNAGILMEEGDYLEAYRAFKEIKNYSVSASTLNELEYWLYIKGIACYKDKNYSRAKEVFEEIPNYKRSSDYLLLIDCSGDDFDSWSNADYHYSDLLELINNGFEDADEIILHHDSLLEKFLTARWEDGEDKNPYYFELYEDDGLHAKYNLPNYDVDGSFSLNDGEYSINESETSKTICFSFTLIDENTISVFCYKDRSIHTLYRQ